MTDLDGQPCPVCGHELFEAGKEAGAWMEEMVPDPAFPTSYGMRVFVTGASRFIIHVHYECGLGHSVYSSYNGTYEEWTALRQSTMGRN